MHAEDYRKGILMRAIMLTRVACMIPLLTESLVVVVVAPYEGRVSWMDNIIQCV